MIRKVDLFYYDMDVHAQTVYDERLKWQRFIVSLFLTFYEFRTIHIIATIGRHIRNRMKTG